MQKSIGIAVVFVLLGACSSNPDNGSDAGSDSGNNNDSGQGSDANKPDGSQGGFTCSTGTLFAGDPVYTGDVNARPTSGTGIKADPPLVWQTIVFSGTHLYTRQESEVWGVDTSASSPVETKIAGNTPSGSTYDFNAGTCAAAAFTQLRGLATMADGSLIASDYFANAIVHITNPNDASCAVTVLAGTAGPLTGVDPSDVNTQPVPGNANGKGTAASFNGPTALTADSAGNIYVADVSVSSGGAQLVRKIDSTGTVSTLATLGTNPGAPMRITNFVTIGTALYAASQDDTNSSYVIQIDTSNGNVKTILGGDSSKFPPVDQGSDPAVTGITTDGTNLIVAGDGYVWYLTLAGQLTFLAGTGNSIDFFPSGYDPKASHAAADLALPTAIGSADENGAGSFNHIAFSNGAIYYRGFADGSSAFIERIACP